MIKLTAPDWFTKKQKGNFNRVPKLIQYIFTNRSEFGLEAVYAYLQEKIKYVPKTSTLTIQEAYLLGVFAANLEWLYKHYYCYIMEGVTNHISEGNKIFFDNSEEIFTIFSKIASIDRIEFTRQKILDSKIRVHVKSSGQEKVYFIEKNELVCNK